MDSDFLYFSEWEDSEDDYQESMDDIRSDDEQYFFDTYDRIIDSVEFNEPDDVLDSPNAMGMAFAVADEIADSENSSYDLNETTDEENWQQAMRQNPTTPTNKKIGFFEEIINDVCVGKRSLFKVDDI